MSFDVLVEPAGITNCFVEPEMYYALQKTTGGVCMLHKVLAMPANHTLFDRTDIEATNKDLFY